jgi:hypothetical protein
LLARTHAEAIKNQRQSLYLDFQIVDEAKLTSIEALFKDLAWKISEALETDIEPDDCWRKHRSAKDNLTGFIKKAVLEKARTPVLILFDEVDRLFSCSFRDDFFATIRAWHNLRATDVSWNHLNMVIAHSIEPYLFIQNIHQSPFNVGLTVRMEDFDYPQIIELNTKYGMPLKTDIEIRELFHFIGGQPYLVRLALYTIKKTNCSIEQLKNMATEGSEHFYEHLKRFVWYLEADKGLKNSFHLILQKGKCNDEEHFIRLLGVGLVKGKTRHSVKLRYQLYDDYFRNHL